jgi:hypothetical protein
MLRPGMTMVSRTWQAMARTRCGCCGAELNAHQAVSSGICGNPRCQEWKIEQVGAAKLARQRQQLLDGLFAAAAPAVEQVTAEIGGGPVVRGTVPWQDKPLTPRPDERRAAFEAHLRAIVEAAFETPVPEEEPGRAGAEADEAPALAAACAVCRGLCCDRGGTTAMLGPAEIGRWRRREPEGTPQQAVAAYRERLPAESVVVSCVYLGAAGCTLPRRMRNDWCNRFSCRERDVLAAALAESGGERIVIVAHDEENHRPGAIGGWSAANGPVHVPFALSDEGTGGTGAG